jgi:hypothetical protein
VPAVATAAACRARVCVQRAAALVAVALVHRGVCKLHPRAATVVGTPFALWCAVRCITGQWLLVWSLATASWLVAPTAAPVLLVAILHYFSSSGSASAVWRIAGCSVRGVVVQLLLPVACLALALWCGLRMGCEADASSAVRQQCAARIWSAVREHAADVWSQL